MSRFDCPLNQRPREKGTRHFPNTRSIFRMILSAHGSRDQRLGPRAGATVKQIVGGFQVTCHEDSRAKHDESAERWGCQAAWGFPKNLPQDGLSTFQLIHSGVSEALGFRFAEPLRLGRSRSADRLACFQISGSRVGARRSKR